MRTVIIAFRIDTQHTMYHHVLVGRTDSCTHTCLGRACLSLCSGTRCRDVLKAWDRANALRTLIVLRSCPDRYRCIGRRNVHYRTIRPISWRRTAVTPSTSPPGDPLYTTSPSSHIHMHTLTHTYIVKLIVHCGNCIPILHPAYWYW